MNNDKLTYSVTELMKVLGIGRNNAYELVNRPDFPSLRIAKRILIPKKELNEWISANVSKEMEGKFDE